jgi:hypothetical protein
MPVARACRPRRLVAVALRPVVLLRVTAAALRASLMVGLFVWLVADGWCWFVLREKYCWLVVGSWFVLRENYCWWLIRQANRLGDRGLPRVCSLAYKSPRVSSA